MLNNYFSSVFNVPAEDDLISNNDSNTNDEIGTAPLTNIEHTLPNVDIHTEDVSKAINGLKINESPGPDNIYSRILKKIK